LFYLYTWLRGIRAAELPTIASALLTSIVGPNTLDWSSLSQPHPFIAAAVAGVLLALAIQRHSTWRALAGASLIAAGIFLTGPKTELLAPPFWLWHAPLLGLFAVALLFDDPLAQLLRAFAWSAVPLFALVAAVVYPWTMPDLNYSTISVYLALLFAMSLLLWWKDRRVELLLAILATFAANLLAHARHTYIFLDQTILSGGLPYLAAGAIAVLAAFLISLLKMNLHVRAWHGLKHVNAYLSGPIGAPNS
jgi:hypothetical protein